MHAGCPKTKEKNNCHVMHQNEILLLSNKINGYYALCGNWFDLDMTLIIIILRKLLFYFQSFIMCLKIAKSENIYYKSHTRFSWVVQSVATLGSFQQSENIVLTNNTKCPEKKILKSV